ncbi:MAG: HTH-type transcriptional repressor PurR [candidate division BRC1 bacterium ADurb.BinA364]|nr:MAG: HTH-type transcriptional repressor PurR [candidate division BRC1 bacterium ADurb.BinA364]
MGRMTITELSRLTGFSKTTISHVMNDTPGARIRKDTREKIRAAALEHRYVPNYFARNIIRGKTKSLGFLTHDLETACFSGELAAAESVCRASGYQMSILFVSSADGLSEDEAVQRALERGMDGLYADSLEQPGEAASNLGEFEARLALGQPSTAPVDRIYIDWKEGFARLAGEIRARGHRIAALAAPPSERARLAEARTAFSEQGLRAEECSEQILFPNEAAGEMDGYFHKPTHPTVVVCFRSDWAIGLLTRLAATGVAVPGQISILLVGAAYGLGFETPSLARLECPFAQRAASAMQRLIERAKGQKNLSPLDLALKPRFVEGGSFGQASKGAAA